MMSSMPRRRLPGPDHFETRRRYQNLLVKLDTCVKKDVYNGLVDKCQGMEESIAKVGLQDSLVIPCYPSGFVFRKGKADSRLDYASGCG
jgi:hypothetical protein